MLRHVSSRELTEWMAYETVAGPVGPQYEQSALRTIVELLRDSKDVEKNPYPRPDQWAAATSTVAEEASSSWENLGT